AVVIDITDRKRSEKQLAAKNTQLADANADLERSNRDLEQFAYIAIHDLKEPLRMVASYTELLEERYSERLDEKGLKYINYARDGARRMQQMVAELLLFSRVSSGPLNLAEVRLRDIYEETLLDLRQEIRDSD